MNTIENKQPIFVKSYDELIQSILDIDPISYGTTRNYINGSITYLSPYISRGIISTKFVLAKILERGYKSHQIEKFTQELAWRDYWQQIWISKQNAINSDLKQPQTNIANTAIPQAIVDAKTGIKAIDDAIIDFYKTGYLHNHVRMYIAFIACNMGQSHWKLPAKWMYYHLLDADWASNALSWQWVTGANSHKKYITNQDNINKYCLTEQKGTFLDFSYEEIAKSNIPTILKSTTTLTLETPLPIRNKLNINQHIPTCIYNFYNLDPIWKKDSDANRVLLLEPSHFREYPVSQHTIDYVTSMAKKNIPTIQIYVGEFDTLCTTYAIKNSYFKEHPLSNHYQGTKENRDWMFDVQGYYPSFFSFWKKCKKQLPY